MRNGMTLIGSGLVIAFVIGALQLPWMPLMIGPIVLWGVGIWRVLAHIWR